MIKNTLNKEDNNLKNSVFWKKGAKTVNKISVSIFAIFLVMFLTWLFLFGFAEHDGSQIFKVFFYDPFRSFNQMKKILSTFAPFFIGALAVWICLKIGLINLGVGGQMSFAALGVYFSVYFLKKTDIFNETQSPLLWLPLLFLVGIFAATLLSSFCGILKIYFNVNEVLSTIFVNYIIYHLYRYLVKLEKIVNATKLRTAEPIGDSIAFNVFIGILPLTFFFALLFFMIAIFVYQKTKLGFQFKTIDAGEKISKYSGINIKKMSLLVFVVAGILSGIAGVFYYYRDFDNTYLYASEALPNNGFDTISIVWLSQSSLFALPFVSFFVALIRTQQKVILISSVDPVIVEIIIGFMILSVAFFTNSDNHRKFLHSRQFQYLKTIFSNPKATYSHAKRSFQTSFHRTKNSPPVPDNKFVYLYKKINSKKNLTKSKNVQLDSKDKQRKKGDS